MTRWARPEGVSLRLILVRHGAPEVTAEGRCYGKLDVGLSEAGRAAIARLADGIARAKPDAVYTSPRRRARESAALLQARESAAVLQARESAAVFSSPVTVDDELAEIDFGELEGMTYDDAADRYPDVYERWMTQPTEVEFPSGESFAGMKRRVLRVLERIRARHTDATVVVVSHGGVNRIVLANALRVSDRDIFRMAQDYAGVSIIDELDRVPIVRLLNGRTPC